MSLPTLGLTLPSPTAFASGATALFALLGLTVGVQALRSPQAYAKTFGFAPRSPTAKAATTNAFVAATGGRNVGTALGLLGCLAFGYKRAVGVMLVAGLVVGGVDGWTVWSVTKREEALEGKGEVDEELHWDVQDEGKTASEELKLAAKGARVRAAWNKAMGHWVSVGICGLMGVWLFVNGED
jgi:hypothetical protein